MDAVVRLIGGILLWLHGRFPLPVCSRDWLATVAMLGAAAAVPPALGAIVITATRKFTGNRSGAGVITAFVGVAAVLCLGAPLLAVTAANRLVTGSAETLPGLSGSSCFVADQRGFLTGSGSVYQALGGSGGGLSLAAHVALLVLLPAAILLATLLAGHAARRRGRRWPGRLLWVAYVLLWAGTLPLEANLVALLWTGYAPLTLLGAIVALMIGPPRRSVIERRAGRRVTADPSSPARAAPAPTATLQEPGPPAPVRLADTPGPLPFATPEASTRELPADVPSSGLARRFRTMRTLGSGGFGTVWLARDTQLDRTVAVKFARAPDAESEQRMMREARALAAVTHPNCVHIYDVISEADGLGIVMEYIDGNSLAEVVASAGTLSDLAAARLWSALADALEAAHGMGVLHRDVKPSNVIVDPAGAPHLIDFGVARARGDRTLTATGVTMGTPDYLAPETAVGGEASPASDAWQLAATVSYALAGQPPRGRHESTYAALEAAVSGGKCSQLPSRSAHAQLLRAALRTDPSRRPSMATVRAELATWLGKSGHAATGTITTGGSAAAHRGGPRTRKL
jgi:predicted Ser/Thr protein kinase